MCIAALLLFIRALHLTLPLWIVAGWSAAESAIFFLVADVPISWIAVRSGTRAALLAAIVAALAAVAGAAAVLFWAGHDPSAAAATMASLPAVDPALIAHAASDYHHGALAMLAGSFSGTPFKLYALEAAKGPDYGLLLFAPLVRLPRFLAVALFVGGVSHLLSRWMDVRRRRLLLAASWVVFYTFYFAVMPG
ncbi:MAG TPA: hypothetical protein VFK28_04180 [Sphingomicrobium sp.]|nr:hypothetical protein [Sphingomicrobium sp.]